MANNGNSVIQIIIQLKPKVLFILLVFTDNGGAIKHHKHTHHGYVAACHSLCSVHELTAYVVYMH